jgi:hypothetical protein
MNGHRFTKLITLLTSCGAVAVTVIVTVRRERARRPRERESLVIQLELPELEPHWPMMPQRADAARWTSTRVPPSATDRADRAVTRFATSNATVSRTAVAV